MAKKFNFVVFEDIGSKFGNVTISLTKNGSFGLNAGFYKKEGLKQYSSVILSFDKDKKAVGFRFTSDSDLKGAWKITHIENSANFVPHSFFRAYAIDPADYAGRYSPQAYNGPKTGKLFYIILQKKPKAKT